MRIAPFPPGVALGGPQSVTRTFVRLRRVEDGIACLSFGRRLLEYRGILRVNTVNLAFLGEREQDALIEGFKGFLNGISFPVQILIRNLPYNVNTSLHFMDSVQGDLADIAHDYAAFVRHLASKRALVKRFFYVVVPAERNEGRFKEAEAFVNAQAQIRLRLEELQRQLERLGLSAVRLTDEEIIALYQSCLTPEDARLHPISSQLVNAIDEVLVHTDERLPRSTQAPGRELILFDAAWDSGHEMSQEPEQPAQRKNTARRGTATRQHTPGKFPSLVNMSELLAPSCLQIFPKHLRIDSQFGHEYIRTLALVRYPRSAYPGWLDTFIQVNEPYVEYSIHIRPLESKVVNSRLSRKATEFRGAMMLSMHHGKSPDPSTKTALEDVEVLRENIVRGDERVFSIAVFMQVRGRSGRELTERTNRILTMTRSLDFLAIPANWQHHMGFLSCLPEGDNQLGWSRLFGTGAASTFYPFTGGDSSMESGIIFGVLPNGGLMVIDPFNSQELENANMVVFAKSGAGKSFFLKTIASRLLPLCNVYVIDPEAEYNRMCEHVRGRYVRLSSSSLQLNPMELYGQQTTDRGEDSTFFREKILNLVTFCELLLSDNGSLSQKEKAFLHRCIIKTYEAKGITLDPATHSRPIPSMRDLYATMTGYARGEDRLGVGEDVYSLSERLEGYLHLFPEQTTITLDKRFIDFNIRELNDSLKPIGLFLITEFLWTKMRQARASRMPQPNTIILIDEAWLLMQFPQGAKFLAEFARRIRKYGGGLWTTTQNSEDFLNSEEGRTILAMSTLKFLMKQDATTIESVERTFHLSESQKNFLLSVRRGEGLFSAKGWTALEVVASAREFEIANTTLETYKPLVEAEKP